jgi:hypothetical protein
MFLLLVFTFSCAEIGDNRSPDDLIPAEQMSAIMADIIIMKNIKRESSYIKEKENLLVQEYLFEKYGIDSLQLANSQSYYAKNPKKYVPIFKMVENHLKKLSDSIEVSMRANEE